MVRYILKMGIVICLALPVYLLIRIGWIKRSACRHGKSGRAGKPAAAEKPDRTEKSAAAEKAVFREAAMGCFVLFHIGLLALALEGEYSSPVQMAEQAAERLMTGTGINLVPFRTITAFFAHFNIDIFMVNIVGNIVMFMPWGFGLVLLWEKNRNIRSVLRCSLLLPLFIETCQLFIGRSVDVDDLILNFAGGCLGAGIYRCCLKRHCRH